ncbi:MAG: 23S rRNA (guanosine(2251)-2'-O)-methyltransferase RlmB [Kiritimatiellia bacterium]
MGNGHHKGPRELCTGGEWIYGRNPVIEVLQAERRTVSEIVLPPADKNEADEIAWIRKVGHEMGCVVRSEERRCLDVLTKGGHHQGVAIKTSGYPYVDLADVVADVDAAEDAIVVVLDHLEDPQNVGSILRTACAVGVTGVVIPEDRSAGITPAVVRASAGAAEHLKIARVVNLVRAMKTLQKAGVWFTGLDWGKDAKTYVDVDFRGRCGLVVGSEGDGISRLVRETCDFIAVLPMVGRIESLNAGVAAAVCMYEMLRQRS